MEITNKKTVNDKMKKTVNFLLKYKKYALVICLSVVIIGGVALFFISKFKFKHENAPTEPVGLIDQYRKQLPGLEKKADNGNPNDLQQYGIALYATGDLTKAEEVYKKQAAQDDKNPMVHNNLANVLRDQKKFEEAIKEYEKAIELNPQNANTYLNLASVYQYSLNDFDGAMKVYQRAIQSNSKNVDFLNMAALALEQHGDKDKAKENFQKVLSIDSENMAAKAGLERIGE